MAKKTKIYRIWFQSQFEKPLTWKVAFFNLFTKEKAEEKVENLKTFPYAIIYQILPENEVPEGKYWDCVNEVGN